MNTWLFLEYVGCDYLSACSFVGRWKMESEGLELKGSDTHHTLFWWLMIDAKNKKTIVRGWWKKRVIF